MFRKIRSVFFGNKNPNINSKKITNTGKNFADFLKEEVDVSSYIKPECREIVHEAIIKGHHLKHGPVLSADEKRGLGINTRFKVFKIQVEALTQEGLEIGPSNAISLIELRANSRHVNVQNQIHMLESGVVKYLEITCANDGRSCSWCEKQDGQRYPVNVDMDELIQDNCTCEYFRCSVLSVLDNDDISA